jgi:uncharacterized protein
MKIWFDLSNSPHINLFAAMIRELEGLGHQVVITCRPLANTVDLLDLHGFRYTIVGEHYGAKIWRKVFGYPIRIAQLRRHLAPMEIDVAVSQSSFHSPVVARLLGVPSIYMNDNEHALGNVPAFLAAKRILVPEFLSAAHLRRQMARRIKLTRYPGVKEGIYLWQLQERLDATAKAPRQDPRPSVYIRPEPWTAQYYRGQRNFLDALVLGLQDQVRLTLLPRGKEQGKHYRDQRFAAVRIVDTAMDIADIAPDCDVFVGAGGTMTREMAVLGIPTVSVYQDELLDVDRYLLEQGAFVHRPQLQAAELLELAWTAKRGAPNRALLDKGRQAYGLVRDAILQA